MGDFYGTGIEIWADLANFEAGFFMFSWAKKVFFKIIVDVENIFGIE